MTIRTIQKITCTALAVQVVLVLKALRSLFLPLTVRIPNYPNLDPPFRSDPFIGWLTFSPPSIDAKQARDLLTILSEAKQQIDPRLAEMGRFGGGGGASNNRWSGGRGRGRGGFTSSNAAPIGGGRRW